MKQPQKSDYEARDEGSSVVVLFKPTKSYFTFSRLDPSEWAKHGPVSASPHVRHVQTGDTGQYIENEVMTLALAVAREYARKSDA